MDRRMTLQEFVAEWNPLLQRRQQQQSVPQRRESPTTNTPANATPTGTSTATTNFDCSTLYFAPHKERAERVATEFVQKWEELDRRKIADVTMVDDNQHDNNNKRPNPTNADAKLPRWYEKHVRLPEQFDYRTRREQPPVDHGSGDRVLSLDDPQVTLSYERELWKLFQTIPTSKEWNPNSNDNEGIDMPHTTAALEMVAKDNSVDRHTGLRMDDRHDFPPFSLSPTSEPQAATIRFECFRLEPKRGTILSDPNRMVLEFLGSQTLLDLHGALLEVQLDESWRTTFPKTKQTTPGYILIEDQLYIAGNDDENDAQEQCISAPVLEWLRDGSADEVAQRLSDLGLPALPNVQHMGDTKLEQVSCRLGVRYSHVCHGHYETAIFVTDRRLISHTMAQTIHFPLLHDVRTVVAPEFGSTTTTPPFCHCCATAPTKYVTSTSCPETGGQTMLCSNCCSQLKVSDRMLWGVWQEALVT